MIDLGLIACGSRIRQLLSLLPIGEKIKLRGVFDPAAASVDAVRRVYPDVVVHPSASSLLEDRQIDWVMIGSWNSYHCEQTCASLEAGKHVFCEKPLATSLEDCLKVREACEQSERQFVLGLVLRYSPHYQKIKQLVEAGAIGRIISMEFNETLHFTHGAYIHGDWRRLSRHAGSHLLEKCCHDIDLANWIVNSLPERVASFGGNDFFQPHNVGLPRELGTSFATWPRLEDHDPFCADKDIVDNQVALIEYYNKVRATFHTNCSTNLPERRMYLCGTHGTLRADAIANQIELSPFGDDKPAQRLTIPATGSHGGADKCMAAHLVETMVYDAEPLAGVDEGICSTVCAIAIDQAMQEGRVVNLHDLWEQGEIEPHQAGADAETASQSPWCG